MHSLDWTKLLLATARHLSTRQILRRCNRILAQSWRKATHKRAPRIAPADIKPPAIYPDIAAFGDTNLSGEEIRESIQNFERLRNGEFCFLNRCIQFDTAIRWHDSSLSRLWRYHLHYFEYVQDLLVYAACRDSSSAYRVFRAIASSWMQNNNHLDGDGWHPYTVSIRLVNWLAALSVFDAQLSRDPEFYLALRRSLAAQAHILSADLETDVRGNHLIANLRALIFWDLATGGSSDSSSFRRLMRMLCRELEEQILPDGGHFERSPGYHCQVLKHILEIALCLRRADESVPEWLDEPLRRMLEFLIAIIPPNGALPLLKDTTWDGTSPFDVLAAGAVYFNEPRYKRSESFGLYPLLLFGLEGWNLFCGWPVNAAQEPSHDFPASRYYVMRDDALGDHLIFDAGKPCPDYLPAHAHADLLSYELQVSGERIVVDSGVYEYTAGMWRDHFRSTRAHNTVELAGANQSEVWSSFRVARRARPGPVLWLNMPDHRLVQGSHNGYLRLPNQAIHRRTLLWKPDQYWLFLDEVSGAAPMRALSYLHIHPKLWLDRIQNNLWHICGTGADLWVAVFGQSSITQESGAMGHPQGWYSEFFGERRANPVLSMEKTGNLPFCFGYVIFKNLPGKIEFRTDDNRIEIGILQAGRKSFLSLFQNGSPEVK